MPGPAIQVCDVVRRYDSGRGVSGISMAIETGECHATLGPNGSGKTTLIRLAAGFERPDAGNVTILGHDVSAGERRHLARTRVMPDASAHWEVLSGWENACFTARMYRLDPTRATDELRRLFADAGLEEQAHDPVAGYSLGMRRKLHLIELLCCRPDVLILDEPTIGIDSRFKLWLAQELHSRSAGNLTTWIATNDPDWVQDVATRVSFVESGCLVADGTVSELAGDLRGSQEVRIELAGTGQVGEPGISGVRTFVQAGVNITAVIDPGPAMVARLIDWLIGSGHGLRNLEVRQAGLRDAFLARTGVRLDP